MTTETIDKLFLELAQVTTAKTPRELLLEETLKHANSLLRSAHEIASRKGERTGWNEFRLRLDIELNKQHRIMYPEMYTDSTVST